MNTKIGLFVAGLALTTGLSFAAESIPFAGKWATKTFGDVDEPKKQGIFGKVLAGAINQGNSGGSLSSNQNQTQQQDPGVGVFKGGEETEPPIAFEVTVNDKGKVTLVISEVRLKPTFEVKKLKIDKEFTITAEKFEFTTTEKSEKISNTIRWVGAMKTPDILQITRETKAGSPIDDGPIMFYRAK